MAYEEDKDAFDLTKSLMYLNSVNERYNSEALSLTSRSSESDDMIMSVDEPQLQQTTPPSKAHEYIIMENF